METMPRTYLSYLLRLWRESRGDETIWRASLESAQTGERLHFADVDKLFDHLYRSMGRAPSPESKV
jgi:hypothetical protein